MAQIENRGRRLNKEIRRLLGVLGSAVVTACLVALFFLWQYGPTGKYQLNRALIAPEVLAQFNYNDIDPKTGGTDRFVFDQIVVISKNGKQVIDLVTYGKIYTALQGDKGVVGDHEMEKLFLPESSLKMTVSVRAESKAVWQAIIKVFQEVDFAESGDYYRVLLHQQDPGAHFAYFHHPKIKDELLEIIK